MRVRRDISSIPLRTAEATWEAIVDLVTAADTVDGDQLHTAKAIIASLITDELMRTHPFVFSGVGAPLVIYLRYGADAIQAGAPVDTLSWNPTAGDWKLGVPCFAEDLGWARDALSEKASRIELHDPHDPANTSTEDTKAATAPPPLIVDWSGGSQ